MIYVVRACWAHRAAQQREGQGGEGTLSLAQLPDLGAHSTRIGAAHDLVAAGQDVLAIMHSGGWKDPRMPRPASRPARVACQLNERQCIYLLTAFDLDQHAEARNRHFGAPPAEFWRWIEYGPIGAKQSGLGREMGQEGLEEFTQMKIINMAV